MTAGLVSESLSAGVRLLARQAGQVVLSIYGGNVDVSSKADGSVVTCADRLSEECILEGLSRLSPGIPILGEESYTTLDPVALGDIFWLVDPLDGTREFISRNGEFTVNIALVEAGRPILGVVLAPALGELYQGVPGLGAFRLRGGQTSPTPVRTRKPPREGLTVIASRSHGDSDALAGYLSGRKVANILQAGSSLKLCRIAEGVADLYPRLGRTMEWDIAAGQAVLEAAGGRVETLEGVPLRYGKPGLENPHFVASGTQASGITINSPV